MRVDNLCPVCKQPCTTKAGTEYYECVISGSGRYKTKQYYHVKCAEKLLGRRQQNDKKRKEQKTTQEN